MRGLDYPDIAGFVESAFPGNDAVIDRLMLAREIAMAKVEVFVGQSGIVDGHSFSYSSVLVETDGLRLSPLGNANAMTNEPVFREYSDLRLSVRKPVVSSEGNNLIEPKYLSRKYRDNGRLVPAISVRDGSQPRCANSERLDC